MFKNKKIFILGMARSGYAVSKLLLKYGSKIVVTDAKPQNEDHVKEIEKLGGKFIMTNNPEELLDETFDFVIKNPGIKLDHEVCKKAKTLNIPVTNEVEVAYNFLPKDIKIVGISGSNGKTTTTTLIYEILKKAKKPAILGGNIGIPVCDLVEETKSGDILVLEISSHQLNDIINFKTDISILTNLSEVHIDHFGTYENYKDQKVRIFNRHTNLDLGILNLDNLDSMEYDKKIPSNKIYFSATKKADAYLNDNSIYFNNEEIVKLDEILVKGNHNYENIMCAIMVAKQFDVENKDIKSVLSEFKGVEHRLEYVKTINGISFYNDSKATNVKSTQIALSAFSNPVILLLGGLDRGHSFSGLTEYLKNTKAVVCYGETKKRIKEFIDSLGILCIEKERLEEAVLEASRLAIDGDTVLLSPACASWDQYEKFEDRGNEFKELVSKM